MHPRYRYRSLEYLNFCLVSLNSRNSEMTRRGSYPLSYTLAFT